MELLETVLWETWDWERDMARDGSPWFSGVVIDGKVETYTPRTQEEVKEIFSRYTKEPYNTEIQYFFEEKKYQHRPEDLCKQEGFWDCDVSAWGLLEGY